MRFKKGIGKTSVKVSTSCYLWCYFGSGECQECV